MLKAAEILALSHPSQRSQPLAKAIWREKYHPWGVVNCNLYTQYG